jgi:hypothetical protein
MSDYPPSLPEVNQTAPNPRRIRAVLNWTALVGGTTHPDIAWSYDFPTRQLLPIAGLVAFYNEKVDIVLDGQRLDRPTIRSSSAGRQGVMSRTR